MSADVPMRITRGMKTPPSTKSKNAPKRKANTTTNSDHSGNSMDVLAEAAYLEGALIVLSCCCCCCLYSCTLLLLLLLSADDTKNKRSRRMPPATTPTMVNDEKRTGSFWEVRISMYTHNACIAFLQVLLLLQIVKVGSKAQIKQKKIAVIKFLNVMLAHTDSGEEAYDNVLHVMENLPSMDFP